jgi:hypothetical protein
MRHDAVDTRCGCVSGIVTQHVSHDARQPEAEGKSGGPGRGAVVHAAVRLQVAVVGHLAKVAAQLVVVPGGRERTEGGARVRCADTSTTA